MRPALKKENMLFNSVFLVRWKISTVTTVAFQPFQYSCLETPMDGGAWWAAVHGVANSQTWLSDFTFTFHFHALEKKMATHSSVLAWRIPGTGEPGGLPSVGSHRVEHDWSNLAAAAFQLMKELLRPQFLHFWVPFWFWTFIVPFI